MRKNKIDRDIVIVLVATLITLVVWMGFSIYQALVKHDTPEVLQKYLQEFDPKLDTSVLDQLEKRMP
jgi:hypothetical protein